MADVHLQIFNANGSLVADANTPVITCLVSGTANCNTLVGSTWESNVVVTNGVAPFLLTSDTTGTFSQSRSNSGTTWTFTVGNTTKDALMNYWIFDMNNVPPAVGAGQGGLEIYNSSNVRVFSSAIRPMTVVAILQGTYSSLPGTYTYTSGHTYVPLVAQNLITNITVHGSPVATYTCNSISAISTTNGIKIVQSAQNFLTSSPKLQPNATVLVIDVTNT